MGVPDRETPGLGVQRAEAPLLRRRMSCGTHIIVQVVHRLLLQPLLWLP